MTLKEAEPFRAAGLPWLLYPEDSRDYPGSQSWTALVPLGAVSGLSSLQTVGASCLLSSLAGCSPPQLSCEGDFPSSLSLPQGTRASLSAHPGPLSRLRTVRFAVFHRLGTVNCCSVFHSTSWLLSISFRSLRHRRRCHFGHPCNQRGIKYGCVHVYVLHLCAL